MIHIKQGAQVKQFCTAGIIVLLTLGTALAQEPAKAGSGKATGTVAQALMDMENQWAKASKAGNADALAPMLADDFVTLDSDGSMRSKADTLARVKKAKWTTNEIGDLKVIVHGDAAVVTGSWTGKGTDGAGKAIDAKERWADTWVKTGNGKWQCIASASAPAK
ncbi:MAG: nuclear transport factor 2 family protein [Acidobacteriota bacterium]